MRHAARLPPPPVFNDRRLQRLIGILSIGILLLSFLHIATVIFLFLMFKSKFKSKLTNRFTQLSPNYPEYITDHPEYITWRVLYKHLQPSPIDIAELAWQTLPN